MLVAHFTKVLASVSLWYKHEVESTAHFKEFL